MAVPSLPNVAPRTPQVRFAPRWNSKGSKKVLEVKPAETTCSFFRHDEVTVELAPETGPLSLRVTRSGASFFGTQSAKAIRVPVAVPVVVSPETFQERLPCLSDWNTTAIESVPVESAEPPETSSSLRLHETVRSAKVPLLMSVVSPRVTTSLPSLAPPFPLAGPDLLVPSGGERMFYPCPLT